jgi:hypothetical protein
VFAVGLVAAEVFRLSYYGGEKFAPSLLTLTGEFERLGLSQD